MQPQREATESRASSLSPSGERFEATYLPPAVSAVMRLKPRGCRWPIGWPDDETFVFCGAASTVGMSYCGAHARQSRAGGRQ